MGGCCEGSDGFPVVRNKGGGGGGGGDRSCMKKRGKGRYEGLGERG